MRHRLGQNHVLTTDLDPIHAQLARRGIDQPLHEIVALRPPGAAIGIHRHRVGEHADDIGIDRLEPIDAGQHTGARTGRDEGREVGQRGAHIRHVAGAQREEMPLGIERDLTQRDVVTAMRVRQERLRARRGPFHRPSQLARRVAGQRMLGINEQLHAKATADIRRDNAEALLPGLEDHLAQHALQQPAALGVGAQGEALGIGIKHRQRRTGLHRGDDDAVVHHREAGDMRGLLEQRLGRVLLADIEHLVARHAVPNLRLTRQVGHREISDGGQHVILDHDGLGRIARRLDGLGDDEGHRIAGMAYRAARQDRMAGVLNVAAVAVLDQRQARQLADAIRLEISTGVDGGNARHGLRGGRVDRGDLRRGMRTAEHDALQRARHRHVIGVGAIALQKARILDAADGLSEAELCHGLCLR